MARNPGDTWSTLVLRVWYEDAPSEFRARIIAQDTDGHPVTAAFAGRDELLEAIGRWIDHQRDGGATPPGR
jgi:hypothetical protein